MTENAPGVTIHLPPAVLAQLGIEQLTALASIFVLFAPTHGVAPPPKSKASAARRPPATNPNHWATAAVKAELIRMYPSEDPFFDTETIREAMRACDGPPLPAWSTIGVYAIQTLHLKRGKSPAKPKIVKARVKKNGRRLMPRSTQPIVAFVAPTTAPGTALPPVDADWSTIQREALRQGYELRSHSDLTMFNKTRIARGESPFAIRRARAA